MGRQKYSAFLLIVTLFASHPLFAQTVNVWETTADQTKSLAPQANLAFSSTIGTYNYSVTINDTQTYQTIDGFGAAMCDSSAFVMYNELTATQRAQAMTAMFSPTNGIGLSLCRLPMGASDMAVSNYSYDDNGGAADPNLTNFSIAHDQAYIIPCLKQMLAINPNVKIMGTPWSPPGWMKDSGTMNGGNFLPQYYAAYAQYFVKFIQAYQAQGIPIWSISCENEPLNSTTGYPSMSFPATIEQEFIRDYLGPALENAGLNTNILVYDHNWDQYVYPETVFGDPVANFYSFGTGWHWYGGVVSNQQYLENTYPNKPQYITEAASGTWTGTYGDSIVNDEEELVIGGSEYWSKGAIKWPFALDQNLGPQNGGCNTCWGLISVNSGTQTYSPGVGYYTLGQASEFIQRGAYYVNSNTYGNGNIEDAAFKNPDGSDVVVVLNSSGSTQSFQVVVNGQAFNSSLPASGVATYKWSTSRVVAPPVATPTPQASTVWRVHAGGGAYTDSQGNVWAADQNYVGGAPATNTGTITGALPGSGDTALYENERYGTSLLYNFQVPSSQLYQVTLKFSENYWTASGDREFNVSINGNTVLTNFDIFAAAGGEFKAVDKVFNNISADDLGRIIVQLGPTAKDNAKIDAIQIIPQPGAPTFTRTPTPTFTITPTPTPTPLTLSTWRVNAGGPSYTDSKGNVWVADTNYTGGTEAVTTSTITNSSDSTLYQSQRYANSFSYTFYVPAGSYQVSLLFAETYWTAAGQRVFNVSLNGSTVLTNFDIYATAGAQNKAVTETFNNIAPSGGTITIQLGPASVDNAEVQGILITPMVPTPTSTKTPTATATFTLTSTVTSTNTPVPPTLTFTPTWTSTFTHSATLTPTPTLTNTLTTTPSSTSTNTPVPPTLTLTSTRTSSPTGTPTSVPTASFTVTTTNTLVPPTVTPTNTSVPPTFSFTSTLTSVPVNTNTPTITFTGTVPPTLTFTLTNTPVPPTLTPTSSPTATLTNTPVPPTATPTLTLTNTPVPPTLTPTLSPTAVFTNTFTRTPTTTSTLTDTPVPPTFTWTPTKTWTPVFTNTFTFTKTNTPVPTNTYTFTHTNTPVPTNTFTITPTWTPTISSACAGVAAWSGNFVYYAIGARVTYNAELYQCIQAHTSESTWEPPVVPALWKDLGPCTGAAGKISLVSAVSYPNPSTTGNTTLYYQIQGNSTTGSVVSSEGVVSEPGSVVYLKIYSTAGRLIWSKTMTGQDTVSGDHNVAWNCKDASGVNLANGVYYYTVTLKTPENQDTKKVPLLILK